MKERESTSMKNIVVPSNTQKSFNISPVKNKYGYDGIMDGRSSGESEKWKGHLATVALYTFHSSVIDHHLSLSLQVYDFVGIPKQNVLFILCRQCHIMCPARVLFFLMMTESSFISHFCYSVHFYIYDREEGNGKKQYKYFTLIIIITVIKKWRWKWNIELANMYDMPTRFLCQVKSL